MRRSSTLLLRDDSNVPDCRPIPISQIKLRRGLRATALGESRQKRPNKQRSSNSYVGWHLSGLTARMLILKLQGVSGLPAGGTKCHISQVNPEASDVGSASSPSSWTRLTGSVARDRRLPDSQTGNDRRRAYPTDRLAGRQVLKLQVAFPCVVACGSIALLLRIGLL